MGKGSADAKARLAALVPAWRETDEILVDRLLADARIARLDRDSFVFRAGDRCDAFLVLLSGSVRVQLISSGGREITLYRIGPGGSCILTTACLLSRESYPAEAVAESDTSALAISTAAFQAALEDSRWFRTLVFDGFSHRLASVIQKIEEIAFTSIEVRLANYLLALDNRGAREVTHQHIAAELGTAREVVSRHLKRLEARGWVELGRGRIAVVDRRALESMAGPPGD